ncbi:hypothetical protein AB4K20DRAFT_1793026 [Rhizopus microsporus]|uniref:Uncharacterized protein n=1 Tax=Rhizopus microsporus TaxID=58291 RepID=A0A1X0RLN7_RHIZD|nr:hypothetical protein BCV71DRAFT_279920 [Rhizopus microsporus]
MEVKLTSRMLTTIETKPHINNVRQKLDTLFKQGSNNTYEDESVAFCDTVDNIEAGFDPKSDEELNDERSIHCGIFVPLFKAFGNYVKKKAKDSDYVWLASNDFTKDRKDTLKLLDGVGHFVMNDMLNYPLMESSGFSFNDKPLPHSLNDTLKNIKNGHGSLKFFVSNYRDASFDTMKSIHLFSFQIIQNKITLIKYSTKSPTTWRVVKCRSTSVPLFFSDVLEYMKVFELFVFLHNDIHEQEDIFKQLKCENLNIVAVKDQDTVTHSLL